MAALSPREVEALRHFASGLSCKQVALQMGVSLSAVRTYVRRARRKVGGCNITSTVAEAARLQLI